MLSKLMHRFHERLLAGFKRLLAETATGFGQNLPYRLDADFSA